jgi:hypothetical protein
MDRTVWNEQSESADQMPALVSQLEVAEQEHRARITMTQIALGLGAGIGGVLGIIFVLAVGYVSQRRTGR